MKLISLLVFVLISLLVSLSSGDESTSLNSLSLEEAKKLTVKKLKALLNEKGLECKGCAEKDDFAKLYFENQHLPNVENQPKAGETTREKEADKNKDEKMDEVWPERFPSAYSLTCPDTMF